MIGLALAYFVGKSYYELAHQHDKNKWGFAILGIASYYIGLVVGAIIIGVVSELLSISIEDVNDILITLMSVPVGVLACWGLYKILENSWSKPKSISVPDEILDANLVTHQHEEI